jgi:hypothetical protein
MSKTYILCLSMTELNKGIFKRQQLSFLLRRPII